MLLLKKMRVKSGPKKIMSKLGSMSTASPHAYQWDVLRGCLLELLRQGIVKGCHILNADFKVKLLQVVLTLQGVPATEHQCNQHGIRQENILFTRLENFYPHIIIVLMQ